MAIFKTLIVIKNQMLRLFNKISIGLLSVSSPLFADFPLDVSGQILYLVHRGHTTDAFERYLQHVNMSQEHDYSLLQQMGLAMLEEGACSGNSEIEMMSLLGAGVSLSPRLVPILEQGIKSSDLNTQLVSLNFLSRIGDDTIDDILLDALGSPFLLTRLEALYQLSLKRHPAVLEHLQSLFVKIPEQIRPMFCQIVINLDSSSANQMMRQLLADHDLATRCEAIAAVANKRRDDFLPQIKTLGTQAQVAQQECVATTLGLLKDHSAEPLLEQLAKSRQVNVRLSAAYALYQLGERAYLPLLFEAAAAQDLFAIALLKEVPLEETKELFASLMNSPNKDVQLNAALGLLAMRDIRCLPMVKELLSSELHATGYVTSHYPGRLIPVWRTVFSAPYKESSYPGILRQSAELRHQVLIASIELGEKQFLELADLIFESEIKSLVPTLVELLSNHRSPATLQLLKKQHQYHPSDFVRASCLLALYRLAEDNTYEQELIAWIKKRHHTILIRFSEPSASERPSKQALSADEESSLLIQSFESLASAQNEAGIEALLNAIAYGNVKNRYALAGLLIRTAE